MTQLSKLAILGIAKESVAGTYVSPTDYIPFSKCDFEDKFQEIKDNSYRGNDTDLQGMYQGVGEADWSIDVMAYPDLAGHFLRGMIGPDTVTAGVSTTLGSSSLAGATTLSTVASISVGSYISVDTSTNQEYGKVTAVSGSGPYSLTVVGALGAGMTKAHSSGVAVVSATTHTFKQSSLQADRATYSLTVFDTLVTRSYSGLAFSDLDMKIDPKGALHLNTKGKSFQGVAASTMTASYTALDPVLGWEWTMTNAGGSSTRGLTYDVKLKRKLDVIHASDGTQAPREIFQGVLDVDGTYKAIYENQTDLDLFVNYTQTPTTALLQQPVRAGGASLALTMTKSGYHKGKRNWGDYVEANFSLSGIYNTTDAGAIQAVLKNFVTSQY
jgi:hypothetical protein